MASFSREAHLLDPVANYARRQRFRWQQAELPFYEYRIDLFAFSRQLRLAVAVELKLDRWRRAVQQALLYQLCADRVFIALPESTAHRVDLELLQNHGIGLIAVAETGRCRRIVCPRQSTVVVADYRRYYINLLQKVV